MTLLIASMLMPRKVVAVMVHVSEPETALDWYEQSFPTTRRVAVGEPPFVLLRAGSIQIEIVRIDEKVRAGAAGTVVHWEVEDFNAELAFGPAQPANGHVRPITPADALPKPLSNAPIGDSI